MPMFYSSSITLDIYIYENHIYMCSSIYSTGVYSVYSQSMFYICSSMALEYLYEDHIYMCSSIALEYIHL